MGCLVAPAALGVITTVFGKRFPKSWHIDWLNKMTYGGVIVLAVDHIAAGELSLQFPFFTAMTAVNESGFEVVLNEILSVGVPMTIALVLVWMVGVVLYERFILVRKMVDAETA